MIAFNVGMPEQFLVLADGKTYASDNLLGSDFSAEFASALAHSEHEADSDKSGKSLVSIEGDIAIAELESITENSKLSDVNISPEGQISSPISIGIGNSDNPYPTFNPLNLTFVTENNESESESILGSVKVLKGNESESILGSVKVLKGNESKSIFGSGKVVKDVEVQIGQLENQISVQNDKSISPNLGEEAKISVPKNTTINPLATPQLETDIDVLDVKTVDTISPKISGKVESKVTFQAVEQTLAINQQPNKIENVLNNPQTKTLQPSETANTPNIEIGSLLADETKSEKSPQQPKISPEIKVSSESKLNVTESIEKKTIQPYSEQKQSNSKVKSEINLVEIFSHIEPDKILNQITQPTSKLFTNNVVEISQMNENVQLKITLDGIINNVANSNQLVPKSVQNSHNQQNIEHLTLLSKGIFDKNLDFAPQKPNKTQIVNEPTINILPNAEAAIISSNQVKSDKQISVLHKIVQNPEHIAISIDTSNTESDENSPKENKSNNQSNDKSPATKEHSFVNQVKSENHKVDSELKLNENTDSTVKLPKQSDNSEISELYNKISPFVQKSNNMLVNNHKLTDSETPTKEFARVKISEIPRRIMQLATTQASDGNSSAKLVMHPKSLGTIVVQLEIVKNVVKLHLTGEKKEALSAVESTIGMLKERLQSKGLILDNVEYNLKDSNEQANSGKHNHTEKEHKQIKRTYNNEKLSENGDGNDKFRDSKNLRHDNGTIIEKYI